MSLTAGFGWALGQVELFSSEFLECIPREAERSAGEEDGEPSALDQLRPTVSVRALFRGSRRCTHGFAPHADLPLLPTAVCPVASLGMHGTPCARSPTTSLM